MVSNKENTIRTFVISLAFLLSLISASSVFAAGVSDYDAKQELKRQQKDIIVVEIDEEVEEEETGESKKKPIGHQLYDTERHNNLYDKSNVITAGGGGNMGEGGGAAKSAGGTAGKSVGFSNDTNINQEVVNNTVSDVNGKDLVSETMGFAKDDGMYYKERKGDHAGVKIFELDRNGSLGINDDHIAVSNMGGLMSSFLVAVFGLGALSFFMRIRDTRGKNNYF